MRAARTCAGSGDDDKIQKKNIICDGEKKNIIKKKTKDNDDNGLDVAAGDYMYAG